MPKTNGESSIDQKLDLILGVMNEILEQQGEILDRLNNMTSDDAGFGFEFYDHDDDERES